MDWETCKENVQPLARGRNVDQLNRMLSIRTNAETDDERKRKRDEFEGLLRSDSSNPLQIWHDYISWIEEAYPEGGGEDSRLTRILEKCIRQLFGDPRYKQSEQFLQIFLKYARNVHDQLETFNTIFNAGLFTDLALFYCNWSDRLRQAGDLKKAEEVLETGQSKDAKPAGLLTTSLDRLRNAIEVQLADLQLNGDDLDTETEQSRRALNSLRAIKMKSGRTVAPVERIRNYQQERVQIVNGSNQATSNQAGLSSATRNLSNSSQSSSRATGATNPNVQVTIFNDENQHAASSVEERPSSSATISNPILINNQENERKPGRWCDQKFKSKRRPATESRAAASEPEFGIYQDDEQNAGNQSCDQQASGNQRTKLGSVVNSCALRVLKEHERTTKLHLSEKLNPKQQFHSDLKRMYAGGTEYSFEEIRNRRLKAEHEQAE